MHSVWVARDVLGRIGEAPKVGAVRTSGSPEVGVLRIESLSRLVQAVGYLKYRAPLVIATCGGSLVYPPASVDVGYRRLLDYIKYLDVNRSLGYIDVIGPGY
jgi:hypothetical protein